MDDWINSGLPGNVLICGAADPLSDLFHYCRPRIHVTTLRFSGGEETRNQLSSRIDGHSTGWKLVIEAFCDFQYRRYQTRHFENFQIFFPKMG